MIRRRLKADPNFVLGKFCCSCSHTDDLQPVADSTRKEAIMDAHASGNIGIHPISPLLSSSSISQFELPATSESFIVSMPFMNVCDNLENI